MKTIRQQAVELATAQGQTALAVYLKTAQYNRANFMARINWLQENAK